MIDTWRTMPSGWVVLVPSYTNMTDLHLNLFLGLRRLLPAATIDRREQIWKLLCCISWVSKTPQPTLPKMAWNSVEPV
jgi:hypothetical protein